MAGFLERSLLLQIALLWLLATVTSVASQALPGCPDKCGNLTIPYPFGIGQGCYLNYNFSITCNKSSYPEVAYLMGSDIPVVNISLEQGQVEIMQFVAKDCYHDGSLLPSNNTASLSVPMFTISSDTNKFTAVGCDTKASLHGYRESRYVFTGCMSYCNQPPTDQIVNNGSCSGIGCYRVPMVLDWTIGTQRCANVSKNKPDYACKENSFCDDPENGYGYRCECKKGYKGNPYLQNGCQDVDECKDGSHDCIDEKHCTNNVGSFTCFCPKGYYGNGRKEETRCTANPFEVVEFSIGIGVSMLVVLLGITWLIFIYSKRKLLKMKRKFFEQNGGKILKHELHQRQLSDETALIFSAEQLKKATNNYDESQIVGKGGFGTVYKGTLEDGREVAIKKPKAFDQSQVKTFIYEFIFLSQISHANVVKLLGCCLEREVPLLVYEFVPNGTLSDHIHGKNRASPMSWRVRLRVAVETANALACLHSATPPIIHRDVKPENILLDDNCTAKVSDFGASRLVPVDQTQLSTMVQGTFGYLDPEYIHTGQITEKSDVYSFGVVLVELLTSKRATASNEGRSLVNVFLSLLKDDDNQHSLFQILDDQVAKEGPIEQIKEVAEIGKRCLRVNGEERPSMEHVAMELKEISMMGEHPWVGVEENLEETEYLLRHPSIGSSSINDYATASTTYGNSIVKQEAFEISDGR
ncbi:hypothetical protein COLO4_25789 [Corchorus olitorius]|uniref:Protein kinase domain-containing protein n=1 Tax=Corchorus olitorius TaxID=93759 RepID=A0A1R3I099_9ROSI|nr:hypothetical protein COLO4_25789 [Corchorus olitorius]